MAFSNTYDTVTPAGSDDPAEADDRMREIKAAVQERENVDHYWPLTGTEVSDADAGEHRKVTLRTGSAPAAVADKGFVYAKDVGGKAELFYRDEDGNEVQITTGGILNSLNLTGVQTVAGIKTFSSSPIVPAPTTNLQASTKKYVDDQIAFSAWTTDDADSAAMVDDGTTYTATSDGFVHIYFTKTPVSQIKLTVVHGGLTTILRTIYDGTGSDLHGWHHFSVASGETFSITDNTGGITTTINWRSRGALSKPTK